MRLHFFLLLAASVIERCVVGDFNRNELKVTQMALRKKSFTHFYGRLLPVGFQPVYLFHWLLLLEALFLDGQV